MDEFIKISKDDLLHYIFLLQHLIKEQYLEYYKYNDQNKVLASEIIENQKSTYKKYKSMVFKLNYEVHSIHVFHVDIKNWLLFKESEVI